jgi:hypothetical protein
VKRQLASAAADGCGAVTRPSNASGVRTCRIDHCRTLAPEAKTPLAAKITAMTNGADSPEANAAGKRGLTVRREYQAVVVADREQNRHEARRSTPWSGSEVQGLVAVGDQTEFAPGRAAGGDDRLQLGAHDQCTDPVSPDVAATLAVALKRHWIGRQDQP